MFAASRERVALLHVLPDPIQNGVSHLRIHAEDDHFGMTEIFKEPDGDCVKKTRKRHAVRKMKVGPSEPPCRRRLQTALSCFGPKGRGGER